MVVVEHIGIKDSVAFELDDIAHFEALELVQIVLYDLQVLGRRTIKLFSFGKDVEIVKLKVHVEEVFEIDHVFGLDIAKAFRILTRLGQKIQQLVVGAEASFVDNSDARLVQKEAYSELVGFGGEEADHVTRFGDDHSLFDDPKKKIGVSVNVKKP